MNKYWILPPGVTLDLLPYKNCVFFQRGKKKCPTSLWKINQALQKGRRLIYNYVFCLFITTTKGLSTYLFASGMNLVRIYFSRVPWWPSGLRIWCCTAVGWVAAVGSLIPGPGTSTCHRHGQKGKKKKEGARAPPRKLLHTTEMDKKKKKKKEYPSKVILKYFS